jgi:xanthine dehydrogenase accessory factor
MKMWPRVIEAVERLQRCALVRTISTKGSTPREIGAYVIVTTDGYHGTIGGGALEWQAIATAQSILMRGAGKRVTTHALGPELGQCCGGSVQLETQVFNKSSLPELRELVANEQELPKRRLYLFGAGHVGRALVLALAPLPFNIQWIDPRPGAFPAASPANVTLIQSADPAQELTAAPEGSIALIMTHSHALDLEIVAAALSNPSLAHVGLIGSATKRARFEKRLLEANVDAARVASLICPIGIGKIRSKEPSAIAASTAAQLLILHERLDAAVLPALRSVTLLLPQAGRNQ